MSSQLRREQKQSVAREEIKSKVRELMARQGTAGVSLREVASEMGTSASALYYYFANRDTLITALLLDAYTALAVALETARDEVLSESIEHRLIAVTSAYRQWAVSHPLDFQLIFGTPIPGYEAPGEITIPAATRMFLVIVELFTNALKQGRQPSSSYESVPEGSQAWMEEVAHQIEQNEHSIPTLALYLALSLFAYMHGIVMLELSDHIPSIVGNVATFYEAQMQTMLQSMGYRR